MTVQRIWAAGHTHAVHRGRRTDAADISSEALRLTRLAGVLTNEAHVTLQDDRIVPTGDVALTIIVAIELHKVVRAPGQPGRSVSVPSG